MKNHFARCTSISKEQQKISSLALHMIVTSVEFLKVKQSPLICQTMSPVFQTAERVSDTEITKQDRSDESDKN